MGKKTKVNLLVENWNLKHPVGTMVRLRMDNGTEKITKTRYEAYVTASGHAACFFEGVSGYYLLDMATPLSLFTKAAHD